MFTPAQSVVIGIGIVMAAGLGFTTAIAVRGDASTQGEPAPAASPAPATSTRTGGAPSPRSAPATGSVRPSAADGSSSGPCSADIVLENRWDQGFQVRIDVTNTSKRLATDWVLRFALPAGVTLKDAWNATYDQQGTIVTAEAPSWARDLAPGVATSIGFNATGTGGMPPTSVTLNGHTCS